MMSKVDIRSPEMIIEKIDKNMVTKKWISDSTEILEIWMEGRINKQ